jgi:hypothetical protein
MCENREAGQQPGRIGQRLRWVKTAHADPLRRTQVPLKHSERLRFAPLNQFGFG